MNDTSMTPERQALYVFAKRQKMKLSVLYQILGMKERRMQDQLSASGRLSTEAKIRLFLLTEDPIFTPTSVEELTALKAEYDSPHEALHAYIEERNNPSNDSWMSFTTQSVQENPPEDLFDLLWQKMSDDDLPIPTEEIANKKVRRTAELMRLLTLQLAYYASHKEEETRLVVHSLLEKDLEHLTASLEIFHREFPMEALKDLLRHRSANKTIIEIEASKNE